MDGNARRAERTVDTAAVSKAKRAEIKRLTLEASKPEHTEEKFDLAVCYFNGGYGVEQDYAEAAKWFRKAVIAS